MSKTYKPGDHIKIKHDRGIEDAIVMSSTTPEFDAQFPMDAQVHVQFADGTNSSWGKQFIVVEG
jgi:hypothetical protein